MRSPRDYDNYVIEFECLFRVPEARSLFICYLQHDADKNGFEFLLDVRSLTYAASEIEMVYKVLQIVDMYIQIGSIKQINIDASVRHPIMAKMESTDQRCSLAKLAVPNDLFEEAAKCVHADLVNDAFASFIRSPSFINAVRTIDGFLGKVGRIRNAETTWKLDGWRFHDPVIRDSEVRDICQFVADNPEWKIIEKKKSLNDECHSFIRKITTDSGKSYAGKTIGHLPYTAEHALISFMDFDRYKTTLKGFNHIEYIDPNVVKGHTYAQSSGVYEIAMQFPMRNRASLCTSTLLYDSAQKCYICIFKTVHSGANYVKEVLSNRSNMDCWVIAQFFQSPIPTRCRYVYTVIADFHTPLANKKLFRSHFKRNFEDFHYVLEELCPINTFKPNNSARLLDALDNFTSRFPDGKSWQ
jgi:hypothetical protein